MPATSEMLEFCKPLNYLKRLLIAGKVIVPGLADETFKMGVADS